MRNLILALILIFSFCIPSYGATVFNGTSQYITLADNAAVDIPNSGWTIAGWIQFSTRTGTGWDTILNNSGGSDYFLLRIADTSHATNANKFDLQIFDNSTSEFLEAIESSASFSGSSSPVHVAVRRSGTTYTLWVNGSQTASTTNAVADALSMVGMTIGRNTIDGNIDYFHGNMWDWAKWDRAFTDGEILELSKGFSANCLPNSQKWFYPMGGPYGYYKEMLVPITVTNSSTTTSDAQRIIYCN